MTAQPLIEDPTSVVVVLLVVLAAIFASGRHRGVRRLYRFIPMLVFCYFVPTILSNLGVIPISSPAYDFIKRWMLPASLVLLTLSVDIPSILRLGRQSLTLFLLATATIVIGGPLALLALGWLLPAGLGDQAWKGLAALSGSWIGGGANFVAIGESVGASDSTMALMVVVDVAVANVWTACLFFFAGRERSMDERIGADRGAIDEVRERVESFQKRVARPTNLPDLLTMTSIAIGGTAVAAWIAGFLPDIGNIVSGFTWIVILVTTLGVGLSFTRFRDLEGAGASQVGSVFLYLLIASIGAKAEFREVFRAPALVALGALWMAFHAGAMLIARRKLRAPVFFMAVGSQANVGGAASAPVVASAFHPALATVGVLLGVAGYVLGTYCGLVCATLLELAYGVVT